MGVGEASYTVVTPSLLSDFFPKDRRGSALSIFYAAIPMGSAMGYVLGGQIAAHYGWRAAFFVAGVPGAALAGLLLFLAEPMKCFTTLSFQLKAIMLVLTGLNVWYFHSRVYPGVADWDEAPSAPWQAKMVGAASMFLWFGIIIAGRWTAYL